MDRANNTNKPATGRDADSWVDAVVTLLATMIFGLGWVLVEVERADPPRNGYDAAISRTWIGAVADSIELASADPAENRSQRGGRTERWTERALPNSNR